MSLVQRCFILWALVALVAVLHGVLVGPQIRASRNSGSMDLESVLTIPDAIWIDGRSMEAYEAGHFGEALHLDEDDWEAGFSVLIGQWSPGQPIVVYCDDSGCQKSRSIALRLREELASDRVYWLQEGWVALEKRKAGL